MRSWRALATEALTASLPYVARAPGTGRLATKAPGTGRLMMRAGLEKHRAHTLAASHCRGGGGSAGAVAGGSGSGNGCGSVVVVTVVD